MRKEYIPYIITAAVLLLIYNHADYLYQASIWKWWTWLPLDRSGAKWGLFDFIPHDSWHIVQFIRNHAALIGGGFGMAAGWSIYWWHLHPNPRSVDAGAWMHPFAIAIMLVIYAATRAIAFTLPLELMN